MRRIIASLFLLLLLTGSACAEMLTVETDLPYANQWTYMLRSGDTLHCLTISKSLENVKDLTEVPVHMAAQCSALENGALVPCQDHCADWFQDRVFHPVSPQMIPTEGILGMAIGPQNQTYMIDGDWAVYQWTPGETEPWCYRCALDTSLFDFESFVQWKHFTTDGETLYGCFLEREDTYTSRGTVFSFSLESGESEKLDMKPDVSRVYPAHGNRLLYEGNSSIHTPFGYVQFYYLYDQSTGKETVFTEESIWAFAPDGDGGWYGVHPGDFLELRHFDENGGDGERVAALKQGSLDLGMTVSLSEDRTTAYVSGASGTLIVCPLLDGENEPAPELVLAGKLNEYGDTNTLPDLTPFLMANNGVQITMTDYPSAFDDLALALVSGNDQFDVMVLELSMGNVDSLLDKGYYVDLSDDESIAAYVRNLYPVWRDECLRGNEIVGIPINVRNIYMYMVNLDVWEEQGLGDYPKTYDELFDCIGEWDSMGVLDEVPLFDNHFTSFNWLFERIMYDYMGKCKRDGKPIAFEDETLLHLLSRLEELRPILEAHDARNIAGDGLIFEGFLSDVVHLTGVNRFKVTAENNIFAPLPLGITEEGDCVESVYFTMLVVNPNSQRQELAKAYLSYIAGHPTTWARCHLLEDGPASVREKGYEELDEQYEQLVSELDEKIAAAMKEGDDAVVGRWEQEKKKLADEYLDMWEVRPNMAEMLYQMMPYFTPLTSDGFGFLNNSCEDLTEMFLEGRMDARTYAMRLDERIRMAELEGSR